MKFHVDLKARDPLVVSDTIVIIYDAQSIIHHGHSFFDAETVEVAQLFNADAVILQNIGINGILRFH